MTQQPQSTIDHMPYEQAFQELEALVRQMEEGRIPLEEAIQAYTRGQALKTHCEALLARAKTKIEEVRVGTTGEVTLASSALEESF